MKLNLGNKSYEMTANQKAVAGLAKFLSALIIVGVVFFCEIMYLSIVSVAFPGGLFRALASFGAMAGGLSVLVLLLGKMYWFPEGGQAIASWAFTGVEMLILVLNVLLAFQLKTGHVDSYLAMWLTFSPASPVVALVGWVAMWMLDGSTKSRHAQLAQEQKQHTSALTFQASVHDAQMELQHAMLDSHTQYLMEYANSTELQKEIQAAARKLAQANLSVLSGINIVARLGSASNPIETTLKSTSLAQTGTPTPLTDAQIADLKEPTKHSFDPDSTHENDVLKKVVDDAIDASQKGNAGRLHNNPTVQEMLQEWDTSGVVPTKWNSKSMISRMRNKYGKQYPGIMPKQA